ncbi:HK97-gp10 family putative phage morphogenesis protein [Ornithinimicrobium sp. LYQ92]|uniref:HK97-gp10 family putative phage morphogenesis protein n=1 Tax=Serinicoccus sp. LYQ92 TaxID=3378798 RepID=UPI003852926A
MAAGDPLRKISADLKGETKRVGARGAAVVRKTATAITRDARLMAPVGTPESTGKPGYVGGNLRASISSTITGDGRNGRMSAEIGPTAHYGRYVEQGTSRMAPQPYLFPAADRHEASFIAAMAQAAEPKL